MNIGLKPDEFWNMTFVDYLRYYIFYQREQAEKWDRVRVEMSYILNTQVEKKNHKKPKEIIPLWIDKLRFFKPSKPVKIPTKEEKEEILKKVGKL